MRLRARGTDQGCAQSEARDTRVPNEVIASRLNLVCARGHRHFAPPRELAEWVGRDCLEGGRTKEGGLAVRGRCLETLHPMTVPAHWLAKAND